jgi:hypothetical protein
VVPQTQELQFTYIPGGSEIISIDAYNRSTTANDFVIGITIIKVNQDQKVGTVPRLNMCRAWVKTRNGEDFLTRELTCFSMPEREKKSCK